MFYKLKPEIFPVNFNPNGMYGDQGYPGFLKTFKFEVVRKEICKNTNEEICFTIVHPTEETFTLDFGGQRIARDGIKMGGEFVILSKNLVEYL